MHMDHREKDNQNTKPMNQDAIISGEEQEEVFSSFFYGDHVVLTRGKVKECVCVYIRDGVGS